MKTVNEYISYIVNEIKEKNITDELTILKFIYFDLGKRFLFDAKFFPFGSSKYRTNLYKYHSRNTEDLDNCFKTDLIICRSVAYILSRVCRELDIDIRVVSCEPNEHLYGIKQQSSNYPHVYNEVTLKDGRTFNIDLQDDMRNIKSNSFTKYFGTKDIEGKEYVIPRSEQEIIDRKLGYISEDNYYFDDYLYLLHYYVDHIEDFDEKINFILENIDNVSRKNMGFADREWLHKEILEEFFSLDEFDYDNNTGRIIIINCYKNEKDSGEYISIIQVNGNNELKFYLYDEEEYKYNEISIDEVARLFIDGYISHKYKIHGIDRYVRRLKEENIN